MLMTVTISLRSRRSLKNCEKDLNWFKGAGFQLVVVPFDRARCHFYIAGLAIHFFLYSFGNGPAPRLTTFTPTSPGYPRQGPNGLTSVQPEWSSPPRE